MKILIYAPENLETIAEEKGPDLETVFDEYERANELKLRIYSVIDYETFGANTRKILPYARYVLEEHIDKHYERTEPEQLKKYTEVVVKYNRSK